MSEHVKYLYYHILIGNRQKPLYIRIEGGVREYVNYITKYKLIGHRGKSYIQKVKKAMINEANE